MLPGTKFSEYTHTYNFYVLHALILVPDLLCLAVYDIGTLWLFWENLSHSRVTKLINLVKII